MIRLIRDAISSLSIIDRLIIFVLYIMGFIACVCLRHIDNTTLVVWSVEFQEALFSGRVNDFFRITAENPWSAPEGGVVGWADFFIVIPWGIWNAPIIIVHKVLGLRSELGFMDIIWAKSFLWFCFIISSCYIYRIVDYITDMKFKDGYRMIFILMGGSIAWFISIGLVGQDEIVYICCMLIGLWNHMIKRHRTALIFDSITVMLCPLMIIPVFSILIVREKNIIKLFLFCVISLMVDPIGAWLCGNTSQLLSEYDSVLNNGEFDLFFDYFFGNSILHMGMGKISLYIAAVLLLYCWIYFRQIDDEGKQNRRMILYPTIILMSSVCVFWDNAGVYRYAIYIPFVIMMVMIISCEQNSNGIILLFVIQSIAGIIQNIAVLSQNPRAGLGITINVPYSSILLVLINTFVTVITVVLLFYIVNNKAYTNSLLSEIHIPTAVITGLYFSAFFIVYIGVMIYKFGSYL